MPHRLFDYWPRIDSMKAKQRYDNPKVKPYDLQDFLDYSVQAYDGFGRVLSRALKGSEPPKVKK